MRVCIRFLRLCLSHPRKTCVKRGEGISEYLFGYEGLVLWCGSGRKVGFGYVHDKARGPEQQIFLGNDSKKPQSGESREWGPRPENGP